MSPQQEIDERLSNAIALMLGYFREDGHKCWFEKKDSAVYVVASDDRYKSDYWDPKNNWNQLMKAFNFIEYLPNRERLKGGEEAILEIFFNRYNVYIKVMAYIDADWNIKYIGNHMSMPLDLEKKQEEWFKVIGQFAEYYNINKRLFE